MNLERSGTVDAAGFGRLTGDSSLGGAGGSLEVALGGTPGRGFVVGGLLFFHTLREPELEREDPLSGQPPSVGLGGSLTFVYLGPFVDWFVDERGGFHFGGGLGLAAAVAPAPEPAADEEQLFENIGGVGGALTLQVGYDFFVGSEWSLGPLLRFTAASLRGQAEETARDGTTVTAEEDDRFVAIALMFTALYH
jgi:hypothetical protein